MELERLQIDVRLQTECTDIFPRKKGFTLQIVKDGKKGKIYADHVIPVSYTHLRDKNRR